MVNKIIVGTDIDGNKVTGLVKLVYTDALASGTNEYIGVTYLLVKDEANNAVNVRPRDVKKIVNFKHEL